MVNHEMQTPILTIIQFIYMILTMLNDLDDLENVKIFQIVQYCFAVLGQLEMMKFFVQDLLDLRQLKFGTLQLKQEPFDCLQSIKKICLNFD